MYLLPLRAIIFGLEMHSVVLFATLLGYFGLNHVMGEPLKELEVRILSIPCDKIVEKGDRIYIFYTGRLHDSKLEFDSNVGQTPLQVTVGTGQLFKGWDQGLLG